MTLPLRTHESDPERSSTWWIVGANWITAVLALVLSFILLPVTLLMLAALWCRHEWQRRHGKHDYHA